MMYLITHMGLIFFLYPADIIDSVYQGQWYPILLGFAFHLTVVIVFMKGMSLFGELDLVDSLRTAGNWAAILLLLPVAIYLLLACVITVRAYSDIVTIVFLSNTPLWAIMALVLTISSFMATLGIEAMFRTAILLFIIFIPLALFVIIASFQNADWMYMLPHLDRDTLSTAFVLKRPFLKSLFAFGGAYLFLGFVQPYFTFKRRYVVFSSLVLLPFFLISVYVPILTFGQDTVQLFHFPYIMTIDTISIDWLMFDRISLFFLLSMITFAILFVAMVMWKAVRIIRFTSTVSPKIVIPIAGASIFAVCLQVPDWSHVDALLWWNTIFRLYVLILIPAATLFLGIRYKRKGA
ncbi:GerAB/ArcD/ProY family transporter [Paenibacillus sp. GCM10027627]